MAEPGRHSESERRTVVREMIRHEDALRDQRLGWLLALNGFLFTALAFAWKDSSHLTEALSALGMAVAVSGGATLAVSQVAVKGLRRLEPPNAIDAPVAALSSTQLKDQGWYYRVVPGLYTWRVLPLLLFLAWGAILGIRVWG